MTVTVRELLETRAREFSLALAAGARGLDREIALPRLQQPGLALAGFLPQLHPDRGQGLGDSGISYLATPDDADARRAVAAGAGAAAAGARAPAWRASWSRTARLLPRC